MNGQIRVLIVEALEGELWYLLIRLLLLESRWSIDDLLVWVDVHYGPAKCWAGVLDIPAQSRARVLDFRGSNNVGERG